MLHKFSIDDGAVTYSNRYLGSQAYRSAMSAGKITYSEFATDPCRTLFQRFLTVFLPKPTDNGNVNVNKVPGGLAAFTETPLPIRFRPDTLEALGVYEYDRRLKGQLSTAHPHYDTARSLQYTYTIRLGRKSAYHVIAIASDGAQRLVGSIPTDQPAYMHSFGMTENYLVIAEFPLVVNPLELALAGKPFIRNYRWRPERGVRVHVVHKDEGTVRRVADVPPLFCFHHVNAFEDEAGIVVDLVTYPDASVIDDLYLDRLRSNSSATLTGAMTRVRMPLDGGEPQLARIGDAALEFPRINYEAHAGRPYRFVYGGGNSGSGDFIDSLVKIDVSTGDANWWREPHCYPGEPVFVSAPSPTREDDGLIASVVLDAFRGRSFLTIRNATDLTELARAEVPHHIPFCIHGNFFPGVS